MPSIPRDEYKGEKWICNHYTCESLPSSHSYSLSKGNDSLLNVLAQLGQGSITVVCEGMLPEPQQMENFNFVVILVFAKETLVESSVKEAVPIIYFKLKEKRRVL